MGTPLDDLKIPQSNWEYSEILRDSLTALSWGLDVEDFWAMPSQKRALYIETVVVKSQMQAFEDKLTSDEIRRQSENKSRG
jgi:hypothetical protein